jgi:hypothetical protein
MFRNIKNADGAVAPFEYLPCSAITPKNGMAMTMTGGKLAIASGTTKPSYICVAERDAAVTAGEIIPVIRVDDQIIFETQLSAAGTALNIGDKVTIAADGLRVTATKTDGVAEIVAIEDTAVGGNVHVRF